MNFWLPIIKIENPTAELIQAYRRITAGIVAGKAGFLMLILCAITAFFPFFVLESKLLLALFLLPTFLLATLAIIIMLNRRFTFFGQTLFYLILANLGFVLGTLIIAYPYYTDARIFFFYCPFLLVSIVWTIIQYRISYKRFSELVFVHAGEAQKAKRKRIDDIFLGGVVTVLLAQFIIGIFTNFIIGVTIICVIEYYTNPRIAQRLVVARQHSQMEPYLQEYAGEENEPEV